ncbi:MULTISPECIES: hypothetical protein [Streptomyces]|uniref:hypothetical protein n=1 Tax=Streptomyces TaxID=1883 RepID=UPI000526A7E0|nr:MULTISPECIES: hypothetical protein [Streptomyces]MCX5278248.1 hypothetical protein [Streptomyces virginiae]MYV78559.1 hypothetical protein [Streptomyces sp. SID1046]WSC82813.1 hypothetical protein OHA56_41320 [Streptomyces virginiae]
MTVSRTNTTLVALLAVLACVEAVLITSDAADGVRYGVGAALVAAIVVVIARLAKGRSSN